jgi:hypothetical protein
MSMTAATAATANGQGGSRWLVLLVRRRRGQRAPWRVIDALDDRGLVRAERQLQAIGLRGQHETDRQKRARHHSGSSHRAHFLKSLRFMAGEYRGTP